MERQLKPVKSSNINIMRIILISFFVVLFLGCGSDEECLQTCAIRDMILNEESCTCECAYETRWEAVKINERFCAPRGGYVALVGSETGPNLDTFFLAWPSVIDELNPRFRVLLQFQNCINGCCGGQHNAPDSYYTSFNHGDSLILDWMDAPDCSFWYQSPVENDLHDFRYRLKFKGFLPDGPSSDTMFVRLEYLSWAHQPVHEPSDFVMTLVK
jgi:hypothetical protein